CLAGLLALPVANLALPQLPIGPVIPPLDGPGVVPEAVASPRHEMPIQVAGWGPGTTPAALPVAGPQTGSPGQWTSAAGPSAGGEETPRAIPARHLERFPGGPAHPAMDGTKRSGRPIWPLVVLGAYAGVAGLMLVRLAGSLAAVGRLRRAASRVEAAAWIE